MEFIESLFQDWIHHQCGRRLLPTDQESDQNKGSFYLRYDLTETCLSDHSKHRKEMEITTSKWGGGVTVQQLAINSGDRLPLDLAHTSHE